MVVRNSTKNTNKTANVAIMWISWIVPVVAATSGYRIPSEGVVFSYHTADGVYSLPPVFVLNQVTVKRAALSL